MVMVTISGGAPIVAIWATQDWRNPETWISVKTLWDFSVDIVDHWIQFDVKWLRRPNFHSGEIMSVLTMHTMVHKNVCKIIWLDSLLSCLLSNIIMLLTRCIFKILIISLILFCYIWFIYLLKTQTALHWAAKHGRADIVKLLAGTHGIDVNGKTVSNSYSLSFL